MVLRNARRVHCALRGRELVASVHPQVHLETSTTVLLLSFHILNQTSNFNSNLNRTQNETLNQTLNETSSQRMFVLFRQTNPQRKTATSHCLGIGLKTQRVLVQTLIKPTVWKRLNLK